MLKLTSAVTGAAIYICPSLIHLMEQGTITNDFGVACGEGTIIYGAERTLCVTESPVEILVLRDRAIKKLNESTIKMLRSISRDGEDWKGEED